LKTTKSFEISKHDVVQAWKLVKAKKGAAGVDGETIEQLLNNLSPISKVISISFGIGFHRVAISRLLLKR